MGRTFFYGGFQIRRDRLTGLRFWSRLAGLCSCCRLAGLRFKTASPLGVPPDLQSGVKKCPNLFNALRICNPQQRRMLSFCYCWGITNPPVLNRSNLFLRRISNPPGRLAGLRFCCRLAGVALLLRLAGLRFKTASPLGVPPDLQSGVKKCPNLLMLCGFAIRSKGECFPYCYCWGITNPPVLIGRTFFYGGFQIRRDA